MRHVPRVLRNSAFALLACSAPLVGFAAVQLGVELSDSVYAVSDPFYSVDGAILSAVKPGSLADANGLRPDDLIVRIEWLNGAVRGLHVAGNTALAQRLLQEALAATQARHERFTQLEAGSYTDVASGYTHLRNTDQTHSEDERAGGRAHPDCRQMRHVHPLSGLLRSGSLAFNAGWTAMLHRRLPRRRAACTSPPEARAR